MHALPPHRLLPCLLALLCASPLIHADTPAAITDLDAVKVTGSYESEAVRQERARLERIAGGTNLIQPQKLARLATLRDALDYQPGIVVQDFFGGFDQPRLNIRGSGIQSNPLNRGVLLLQDGLPWNEADGSFVIGLLEPRNASAISVRRGANAVSPGATTLGGELDFRSLTGADENFRAGLETGSDGRRAAQLAGGALGQTLDGHIAASADHYDGYRHHSDGDRRNVQANAGIRRGETFENRSYLSWADLSFRIPTVVPKARVKSDPRGVLGDGNTPQDKLLNMYQRNPRRETQQLRVANVSQWGQRTRRHSLGVYWQNTDDLFNDPTHYTHTDTATLGAQWAVNGHADTVDYHLALSTARSNMDRTLDATNPQNGTRLQRFGNYALNARNHDAVAGLDWHLAAAWSVQAEVKWSDITRNARSRNGNASLKQQWTYATPKIGAIWTFAPQQRLYANLSRSHEAPTFWEIVSASVSPQNPASTNVDLVKLDVQQATTAELGGEGRWSGDGDNTLHWSLSAYRSIVDDELIATTDIYGIKVGTYNYVGGTRHQGLEAGLDGTVSLNSSSALDFRLAWNWSDFRFRRGEFAGNQIAGVPRQMLSTELLYRIGAWRIGPNLRWMPQATPTDHANTATVYQDPYTLLGARVEYVGNGWRVWLLGENLTNQRYASSYAIRNQASVAQPGFLPGNGRSMSAGFSYRF